MNKTVIKEIVCWIKTQVIEANKKGVVFGLSGGLDSAVVSVLCKNAFPKEHLALILPCFSNKQDITDAKLIIKKFKLNYKIVNLEKVFLSFCETLGIDPYSKELAVVNIKPRLRMVTLYHFANKLDYLVVGTGNKSELTMGYFTKYGDGGVDLLPLGDFTKTQVIKLAEMLKIPRRIIVKPPSAGLWQGQTDEEEMGITYQQLDKIIEYVENKRKLSNIDKKLFRKVVSTKQKILHKLSPPKIFNYKDTKEQ